MTIKFPEKKEYDTELAQMIPVLEQLKQENDRLHHLTTVLIEHIWKKQPFPLKEIDRQMLLYDKEHGE